MKFCKHFIYYMKSWSLNILCELGANFLAWRSWLFFAGRPLPHARNWMCEKGLACIGCLTHFIYESLMHKVTAECIRTPKILSARGCESLHTTRAHASPPKALVCKSNYWQQWQMLQLWVYYIQTHQRTCHWCGRQFASRSAKRAPKATRRVHRVYKERIFFLQLLWPLCKRHNIKGVANLIISIVEIGFLLSPKIFGFPWTFVGVRNADSI